MKKHLLLVAASVVCSSVFAEIFSVSSPDGLNEIKLMTEPVLSYTVSRSGKVRIAPTPISMTFAGKGLLGSEGVLGGKKPKVVGSNNVSISGKVETPIYKKAFVCEKANETTVTFAGGWQVVLRARNDGVAYRFVTAYADPILTVKNELAGLTFPSRDLVVCAGLTGGHCSSWESIYTKTTVGGLTDTKGSLLYLPLLVQYPDGVNLCVTESDLLDYPGWNFALDGRGGPSLESSFAFLPDPSKITDDQRHRRVGGRLDYLASTKGTRAFPWRVFVLADSPAKLMEADIVYALASSKKLTGDLSWIKPGKVAWDWWNDWNVSGVPFKAGCNTETYKYYIDFAKKNGLEYVIMDEGWSVKLKIMEINPEVNVPELVKYANDRGVGIILWCSWPQLVNRQDEVFQKYADMGVKGFKIDFMDRDDQFVVSFLEKTAVVAAKYRLMVDYHGMYKPTGMNRTYPNIINYEGVHGLETAKWETRDKDHPMNDCQVAFTRMVAGPLDYTPGAMINRTRASYAPNNSQPCSQGTRCHQMALMTLFEAPLQMLCDSPTQYLKNQECFDFMRKVPVTWDATVGLVGEVGVRAAVARRHDDAWYVGAIGCWTPQEFAIDTKFLGDGEWTAEIFEDGVNADLDPTDYVRRVVKVTAGVPLMIRLAPGGGWTARFSKASWTDKLEFWK